jgi:hypothetical protein
MSVESCPHCPGDTICLTCGYRPGSDCEDEDDNSSRIEEVDDDEIADILAAKAAAQSKKIFSTQRKIKASPCPGCDFLTSRSKDNICLRCGYAYGEETDSNSHFDDDIEILKVSKLSKKILSVPRKRPRIQISGNKVVEPIPLKPILAPFSAPCACPDSGFKLRKAGQDQINCGCPSVKVGESMCNYCKSIFKSLPDRLRESFRQFKSIYFKNSNGEIYEGYVVAPVLKINHASARVRYYLKQWRDEKWDEQIELINIFSDNVSAVDSLGSRRRKVSCRILEGTELDTFKKIVAPEDFGLNSSQKQLSLLSRTCGCPDSSFKPRKAGHIQLNCGCNTLEDGQNMCNYCKSIYKSLPDRLQESFRQFKSIYFKNHVGEIREGYIVAPVAKGNPASARVRYCRIQWCDEKWDEQVELKNIFTDFVSGAESLGSRRRTANCRLRDL